MSKAEKFINDYTKNFSNDIERNEDGFSYLDYVPWLTPDQARKAVEIAREEMIEWIEDNIEQYPVDNWDKFVNSLTTDLKQAMNDESYI